MPKRFVCARCAQIKQACSGNNPCSRCKRLNVFCDYGQSDETHTPLGSTPSARSIKIKRSHGGCTTCKKRKRKCDEARPKCSDCRRLCLECHYTNSVVQNGTNNTSHPGSDQGQSDIDIVQTQSYDASLIGYDVSHALPYDSEVYSPFGTDEDESRTLSSPSLRSSVSGSPSPVSGDVVISSLLISPPAILSIAPVLSSDQDKALFNHYIKVVAVVLSRRDNSRANPYLMNVVPLAISNTLVMDAVLTLSASHWKKLQPDMWKRGIVHQTRALKSLAKLLPHIQNKSADVALIATLMLAMVDLFDGTTSHWKFHLDGVRQLLSAFRQTSAMNGSVGYRAFYNQLYHYLDSATTISTCHPPLLEDVTDQSSNDGTYSTEIEAALYGIPKSLFHFVDKLNGLAYQRKFRNDPVFESMFLASATRLREDIESWSGEYRMKHEVAQTSSVQDTETFHATMAFEQALQLRLHQVVHGYSLMDEVVRSRVDQILDAVQEIHYGSSIESSLVFPLVMAGSSCCNMQQRIIIHDRFLVMERTSGFQYVHVAHDLVQRVWKERDEKEVPSEDVNWAAIRYYDIPGLALV